MMKATLLLPWESYYYLKVKGHKERSGKDFSSKSIERIKRNFDMFAIDDMRTIAEGDLGGCIGKPENAFEQGRWTSWSIQDMKEMLDEMHLPYAEGKPAEYLDVIL